MEFKGQLKIWFQQASDINVVSGCWMKLWAIVC
jgi:hypothetical protein